MTFLPTKTNPVHVLSLDEPKRKIPDEAAAIACLENERPGENRHCFRCGRADGITPQKKFRVRCWCGACRNCFTARTGTPFEYMKVSCRVVVLAGYMMVTHRKGTSSLALSKELGVLQSTAWHVRQRLRAATGTEMDAVKKLLGVVDVDEVCLGGVEKNKHAKKKLGGGSGGKQPVLCLKECRGRVMLTPIADATKETLQGKIREVVETGSIINTDEHRGCRGIDVDGEFKHFVVSHSARE